LLLPAATPTGGIEPFLSPLGPAPTGLKANLGVWHRSETGRSLCPAYQAGKAMDWAMGPVSGASVYIGYQRYEFIAVVSTLLVNGRQPPLVVMVSAEGQYWCRNKFGVSSPAAAVATLTRQCKLEQLDSAEDGLKLDGAYVYDPTRTGGWSAFFLQLSWRWTGTAIHRDFRQLQEAFVQAAEIGNGDKDLSFQAAMHHIESIKTDKPGTFVCFCCYMGLLFGSGTAIPAPTSGKKGLEINIQVISVFVWRWAGKPRLSSCASITAGAVALPNCFERGVCQSRNALNCVCIANAPPGDESVKAAGRRAKLI